MSDKEGERKREREREREKVRERKREKEREKRERMRERDPSEFGLQTKLPDVPGGTREARSITIASETLGQVGNHVAEQGAFLERLLGRPSDGDPSLERHHGALREGTRADALRSARNQPKGRRRGGNETWYDEMNQRIDRMSQLLPRLSRR